MSERFTIVEEPTLGRLTYDNKINAFVSSDLGPDFILSLGPDPRLPENFDKLSWSELEDLSKEHQEELNDEFIWQNELQNSAEMYTELAEDYKKRVKDVGDRLSSRWILMETISGAIARYERRGANTEANKTPTPSTTRVAALPSDAFITKEDMQGDDVDGFFTVEDDEADEEGKEADKEEKQRLAGDRLKAACMWRGGLMAPLPGLPHATAVRFQPPTGTPNELFVHQEAELVKYMRWNITCPYMIRRSAPLDEILIYTDGSCLDQHISGDATKRKAGCAVIFKPELQHDPTDIKHRSWRFRLESVGPTGEVHPQTSDRAELRAVIAALQTIKWASDGWIRVTIASDSAYLVEGITDHIGKWRQRGWRNVAGKPIANRDLSEALLSQVNLHANWGCEIRFWLISRALNAVADSLAKYVAEFGRVEDSYPATPWIGRMPGEGE